MKRSLYWGFALLITLMLLCTSGCNQLKIVINPTMMDVTVGEPADFAAFKVTTTGNIPYNEAVWEITGDDIGSLSDFTGPTTTVLTYSAGNAQVKASSPDGTKYAVANITVSHVLVPTRVEINQPSGWAMLHGDQKAFSASVFDQFDAEMPTASYTWNISDGIGDFSPNPGSSTTFTAGDPGSSYDAASVTASYGSLTSPASTGTISRQASLVSSISVEPNSATLVCLERINFVATVFDQYRKILSEEPITWSLTGDETGTILPSLSSRTTFTAVDIPMRSADLSGSIWARATNTPSVETSSDITVTAERLLTSVAVSPDPVSMTTKTRTVTANAYDQYGDPISADSWWIRVASQSEYMHARVTLPDPWEGDSTQVLITITEAIAQNATSDIEVIAIKGSREAIGTFTLNASKSVIDVITTDTNSISGLLGTTSSLFTVTAWDQYDYAFETTFDWSVENAVGHIEFASSIGGNRLTFKKAVVGSVTASAGGKSRIISVVGQPLTGTINRELISTVNIPDNGYPLLYAQLTHEIEHTSLTQIYYIESASIDFYIYHPRHEDLVVQACLFQDISNYTTAEEFLTGELTPIPFVIHYQREVSVWNGLPIYGLYTLYVADQYLGFEGDLTGFSLTLNWRCDNLWW